ncbi:MAG: BatA domain-containing protein, partial [Gemmatimonadota bacterium]|nr:BatA domain-containing protein [Gemmatimonadota bacterium]
MNLMFLAPLFLAGAAAIAIPILVHLTHRERRETVKFPSLMFLRRVPFRTVRRQRIRHWPLLLLRVAAIALVATAFARPLWDRGTIGPATLGSAREVVVLLDRSYSMGYG